MNHIKRRRLSLHIAQASIAHNMDTSMEGYQEFEKGQPDLTDDTVSKLAKELYVTEAFIRGEEPLIRFSLINKETFTDMEIHFGSVIINFISGSVFTIPITKSERTKLDERLSGETHDLILIESIDNRTYIINRQTIADIFLKSSSEIEDDSFIASGFARQDFDFWKAIEQIDKPSLSYSEVPNSAITHVSELVKQSKKNQDSECLLWNIKKNARKVEWKFINGLHREFVSTDETSFLSINSFINLINRGFASKSNKDDRVVSTIEFRPKGYTSSAFIQTEHLEFLSAPTHLLEEARLRELETHLDHH